MPWSIPRCSVWLVTLCCIVGCFVLRIHVQMTRLWWRLVFLLSILNIILFVFHFAVLFLTSEEKQCDDAQDNKAKHEDQTMKQQSSSDIQLARIGRSRSKNLDNERFTIIILTHGRTEVLFDLLKRYVKAVSQGKLPQLSKVLIVWNNVHTPPPIEKWKALRVSSVPVIFLQQKENRLTNRFRVFPEIDTEAIFTQDDDIYASPLDLKFSFKVFKKFPEKLVGFYARLHSRRVKDGFYLYSSNPRHNQYSMILTGACFIHIEFLQMFQEQPQILRNKIDELMNGEDIAMNMMIANYTKDVSGYYVKPVFLGTIKSVLESGETLHGDNEHIMKRSRCMNEMTKFYGMPLLTTEVTFQQYLYTWKHPQNSGKPNNKSTTAKPETKKNKKGP